MGNQCYRQLFCIWAHCCLIFLVWDSFAWRHLALLTECRRWCLLQQPHMDEGPGIKEEQHGSLHYCVELGPTAGSSNTVCLTYWQHTSFEAQWNARPTASHHFTSLWPVAYATGVSTVQDAVGQESKQQDLDLQQCITTVCNTPGGW